MIKRTGYTRKTTLVTVCLPAHQSPSKIGIGSKFFATRPDFFTEGKQNNLKKLPFYHRTPSPPPPPCPPTHTHMRQKNSNQPTHPRLSSVFILCIKKNNVSSIDMNIDIQNAPSKDSDQTAIAQADLNPCWAQMCGAMLSDIVSHNTFSGRLQNRHHI